MNTPSECDEPTFEAALQLPPEQREDYVAADTAQQPAAEFSIADDR